MVELDRGLARQRMALATSSIYTSRPWGWRSSSATRSAEPCHSDHVDVKDAGPLVVSVVFDNALGQNAGVVDNDVDAAIVGGDSGDGIAYRRVIPYIGGYCEGVWVGRLDVDIEHRYPGASIDELPGSGGPDPRRPAGDDCDETVELVWHVHPALSGGLRLPELLALATQPLNLDLDDIPR